MNNIFEDAIVPETPKALPNEQLFVYVPIGTIEKPGVVTFDDNDFRIDEHGRVYMKVSSTQNAKDIDVLEAARPVTGAITIAKGSWSPVPDGFNTSVALDGNIVKSGDIVLVLPDDANTRIVSADMEVRVAHDLQNGEDYDVLYFKSKTMPTEALYYRFVVIKRGATDTEMTANALIVGVSDVPKYIKDAIEDAIETFNDRITTGGTILVSKGDWGDSEKNLAVQIKLEGNVLKPGTLMVLAPGNDATKQTVAEYGMSMKVDKTVDGPDDGVDVVVLERKPGKVPDVDLTFRYAVIVIGGNTTPTVTLVGGLGGNGDSNLYVGTGTPPSAAQIWINPEGDPAATEVWEFELESGDIETKSVVVLE